MTFSKLQRKSANANSEFSKQLTGSGSSPPDNSNGYISFRIHENTGNVPANAP